MRFDVEAILFDIDGTLVASTAAVERTWRRWAALRNMDAEAILRVCHGRRSEDTIALFLPVEQRAVGLAELEQLELSDLGDVIALPGAKTLLQRLSTSRWAGVTSGSRALMQARLKGAGLRLPEVLISAGDVSAGKPDPEGYLRAADLLGYDVARCLVVEDAPAGIEAGRAAGAHVLAVATSHDCSELISADVVIPDLEYCTVECTGGALAVTTPA